MLFIISTYFSQAPVPLPTSIKEAAGSEADVLHLQYKLKK
jgi:hypothetical protein